MDFNPESRHDDLTNDHRYLKDLEDPDLKDLEALGLEEQMALGLLDLDLEGLGLEDPDLEAQVLGLVDLDLGQGLGLNLNLDPDLEDLEDLDLEDLEDLDQVLDGPPQFTSDELAVLFRLSGTPAAPAASPAAPSAGGAASASSPNAPAPLLQAPAVAVAVAVAAAAAVAVAVPARFRPELAAQLTTLGYTAEQIEKIKQENRNDVIESHEALTKHGFTPPQIVVISKRAQSLRLLADRYGEIREALPGMSLQQMVDVCKTRSGDLAMSTLIELAPALKAEPFQFDDEQLVKIAKNGERPALVAVSNLNDTFSGPPYNLTARDVVSIASNGGGGLALEAVNTLLSTLCAQGPNQLTAAQVVSIASHIGGGLALEAVNTLLSTLCAKGPNQLTAAQVVSIASNNGGKQALEAVNTLLSTLCAKGPNQLTAAQVVRIASNNGGNEALRAVHKHLPELRGAVHKLTVQAVVDLACPNRASGSQAIKAALLRPATADLRGLE